MIEHYSLMKAKQVLPLLCVLALLVCSCKIGLGDYPSDPDITVVKDVQRKQFWAFNYRTSQYYQVTANLYVEGRHCKIWVEQETDVSSADAKNVANIFDSRIYPKMMDTFGIYGDMSVNGDIVAHNTMELADWLGDRDGKLAILLLNIQDKYEQGINESRTTGYFSSSDLLASRSHSNGTDMLYIDINPEKPGSEESNKTIAHEMQHLMNFVTSTLLRKDDTVHEMDTWINEGLSAMAEWVYSGKHSEARWVYYNADPSGLIQRGNNFFVWGNHTNEHQYAELDDYATVYLFFHWLRLQAGNNRIFSNMISSNEYNYRAVTQAAGKAINKTIYGDWETLLKTWLAANYINAQSGYYGYRNDRTLREIKAKTVSEGTHRIQLYPGEGVYSVTMDEFPWPGEGNYIKYVGLASKSPWINNNATFPDGALLTYNVNQNEHGSPEEGITSGISSHIDTTFYERRIRALLSQRTVIDASGILRSYQHDEAPDPAMAGAVTVPVMETVLGIIKLE